MASPPTPPLHVPSSYIYPTTIIAIGALLIYTLHRVLLPRPLPFIPYNPTATLTILGDVPSLLRDPDGLAKWCGRHLDRLSTPICQVFMGPLAKKPMVLVADVGDARDIVFGRSDFDRSDYITDRFPLFRGFHFRMKTGEEWRTGRGWMKDLMTGGFLGGGQGVGVVREAVGRLVELWEVEGRLAGEGRTFDIVDDLRGLALDVISGFYLGGDDFGDSVLGRQREFIIKGLKGEEVKEGRYGEVVFPRAPVHAFTQGMIVVGDRLAAIYDAVNTKLPPGIVSWWFRYVDPSFRSSFRAKDRFLGEILDKSFARLRRGEPPKSGVDQMVYREDKMAAKAGRQPLAGNLRQVMIDEIYGNLIAGQHTTSAALVWILKFVSEYPAVQAKLYAELQSVLGGHGDKENQLPSGADIAAAKLSYLEAVIEETMRLRASFLMPRDIVRDTELMGYRIPKGTTVVLVSQGYRNQFESETAGMKRREYPGAARASKELDEFDPERWLVRNAETGEVIFDGSSYPQMAFGLGVRGCWGRKLAQLEMKMMLALVVWRFELLPVAAPLSTHDAGFDISYRAKKGFLQLRKRGE